MRGPDIRRRDMRHKKPRPERSGRGFDLPRGTPYQILTRCSGGRYMPSPGFTPNAR
jgi:hypothetical protein